MDFKAHCNQNLSFCEFSYNNSYHYSIDKGPFEALYSRGCRSPVGWFDVFEVRPWGTNMLKDLMEKVRFI